MEELIKLIYIYSHGLALFSFTLVSPTLAWTPPVRWACWACTVSELLTQLHHITRSVKVKLNRQKHYHSTAMSPPSHCLVPKFPIMWSAVTVFCDFLVERVSVDRFELHQRWWILLAADRETSTSFSFVPVTLSAPHSNPDPKYAPSSSRFSI